MRKYLTNSISRYLDDLLSIDNSYFKQMVDQIYPTDIQLNKANSCDSSPLFGLGPVHIEWHSLFYYEQVNFPFLGEDDPPSSSYGVYNLQLIRSARALSNVSDVNNRNQLLTAKVLKQG